MDPPDETVSGAHPVFRVGFEGIDPGKNLEINPTHPLIVGLAAARERSPDTAKLVAQQVFDNALIAAGLIDDARPLLARMTQIMTEAVQKTK